MLETGGDTKLLHSSFKDPSYKHPDGPGPKIE